MAKLEFSKPEIEDIKSKVYFTKEELEILDMWLAEEKDVAIYMKLNISHSTLTRKKKKIVTKISRVI